MDNTRSNGFDNGGYIGDNHMGGDSSGAILTSYKGTSPPVSYDDITVGFRQPDIDDSTNGEEKKPNGPTPTPILKNANKDNRPSVVSFRDAPSNGVRRREPEREMAVVPVNGHTTVDIPEQPRNKISMTNEQLEQTITKIRRRFVTYADKNGCISEENFREALGEKKNTFFAERFFRYLDKDNNGTLDMDEITRGARIVLSGTNEEKNKFVFSLYDIDGSGEIDRGELNQTLTSCVLESKMKLNQNEITLLSDTLFDEAVPDPDGLMSEADLGVLIKKFPDALETLTYNASLWLQPDLREEKKESPFSKYFSRRYYANNAKKLIFLAAFWVINILLFALNAYLYRHKNGWIVFARGCGMCLNFCSALVLLLPMRMMLSYVRLSRLSRCLPLDHNISLHKMVGLVIMFWTIGHTIGHLGNATLLADDTNLTIPRILFTTDAKIGWVAHLAPLTGVILDVILVIMVVASRPFVRRGGYFETFFWTHKLYLAYYILGVLHAPNFWKWLVIPGVIFIVETALTFYRRRGGSSIIQVSLLPSAVTQLVITKPPGFNFHAGDYVYLRIPEIAKYEWHPFTISSAPEQEDTFWVHIRSAGHWTKTLRQHLLTHYSGKKEEETAYEKRRASSMAWFARRASMAVAKHDSIRRRTVTKDVDIQVYVDGPYGSPCREIFDSEHAVLIGSGIGVTPFAAILQSITNRFKAGLVTCPSCATSWCHAPKGLMNLKKVDFVWINRDQSNFEWFSSLLCNMEKEQSKEASLKNAVTMHMFMTAAPNQYEINGVGVQMALDLVHKVKKTDLLTGLSTRTQGGRPDFDKLFREIKSKSVAQKIKVFFCGSPLLGKNIQKACMDHGISFSKEQF